VTDVGAFTVRYSALVVPSPANYIAPYPFCAVVHSVKFVAYFANRHSGEWRTFWQVTLYPVQGSTLTVPGALGVKVHDTTAREGL
jgi:hypothetical protein